MTYNNNIDPPVYVLYLQQLTRALAGNSKDSGKGRAIYYIIILFIILYCGNIASYNITGSPTQAENILSALGYP